MVSWKQQRRELWRTVDRFKLFLLNEERSYLGHRVGDVLSAMQGVQDDMPNLGTRHLTKLAEDLVNQIRKILHGHWSAKNHIHLKELQKVGVAIKKTIEEKGDLKELLPSATATVQQLMGKLGVKMNNLDAPDAMPGQNASPQDFQLTGSGPEQQPPQGGQAPPAGDPAAGGPPPMGGPPGMM